MPKLKKIRERLLSQKEKFSKETRLNRECAKSEWQRDCHAGQMWRCYRSGDGRWRLFKCRERWRECTCEETQRRHKRSIGVPTVSYVDEFLREAHWESVRRSEQWFQGAFDLPTTERKRRSHCECHFNTTHPLRSTDVPVSDDLLYDFSVHSKSNKKGPSAASVAARSTCSLPQMNCFSHSADHWRTPPLWPDEYGQFCFCQNSNNNTYWCLRTVNETSNSLYCEFVTEFVSYYDMNTDPYQLTNLVYSLELPVLEDLNRRLRLLRECRGKDCEEYGRAEWQQYANQRAGTNSRSGT